MSLEVVEKIRKRIKEKYDQVCELYRALKELGQDLSQLRDMSERLIAVADEINIILKRADEAIQDALELVNPPVEE
jgi:FtsZ-binding cell division protein ZapB